MAQQTLNNGESGSSFRGKLNTNFTEVYKGLVPTSGTSNFVVNGGQNTIDAATTGGVISGGGAAGLPNHIGKVNGLPVGTDINPGWSADAAYVSGAATHSTVCAGYDNINNSIGSVIGANHCMISYTAEGHNTIVGNSYNWIFAGRSSMFGSRGCSIQGGTFHAMLGGDNNDITGGGTFNTVVNGVNSAISSSLSYNSLVGGETNTISGTSATCTIIAGNDSTIAGTSATAAVIIGATDSTLTGNVSRSAIIGASTSTITNGAYSAIIASENGAITANRVAVLASKDCSSAHGYALVSGDSAVARSGSSITTAAGKLVAAGDCQAQVTNFKLHTTDAALTSMITASNYIVLPTNSVFGGTCYLTGIREDTNEGCCYKLDFMAQWNGTTYKILGSTSEIDMALVYNGAGVTTVPKLAASGGLLRPKAAGLAGVNFKWSAVIVSASVVA